MSKKEDTELPEVRHQPGGSDFSIRVLDAEGHVLSNTLEPTLHAALARARERLRERIEMDGAAHKVEVRNADGLIFDAFAE
jgi:hypothetical protein